MALPYDDPKTKTAARRNSWNFSRTWHRVFKTRKTAQKCALMFPTELSCSSPRNSVTMGRISKCLCVPDNPYWGAEFE